MYNDGLTNMRHVRRFPLLWPLVAGHGELGDMGGQVLNLSTTGLFFQVPCRYRLHDTVELKITTALSGCFGCLVEIVREQPGRLGRYCYGARVIALYGAGSQIIARELLGLALLPDRKRGKHARSISLPSPDHRLTRSEARQLKKPRKPRGSYGISRVIAP